MEEGGSYFKDENHLASYQVADLAQLNITDEQKLRFARAMRVIDIKPHYHVTELEALLDPSNVDKSFWAACNRQLAGCPKPRSSKRSEKKKSLEKYLQKSNEGKFTPIPQTASIDSLTRL
jgi:hypothetical protein